MVCNALLTEPLSGAKVISKALNSSKTQYTMIFSFQINNKLHDSTSIDGESIVQTETAKLLGRTMEQHLKITIHIDALIGENRAAVQLDSK